MKQEITGIILAGGKSTRMGEDKANTQFKGKSLIQWSIDALQPICSEVFICSNKTEHTYPNTKRITDLPHISGPLAGLGAGIKVSNSNINIVVACDTPNVTTALFKEMTQLLDKHQAVVVKDKQGKIHPLIACYRIDIMSQISQVLNSNRQSLMHLLSLIDYISFTPDNDSIALNVNSKKELL